MDEDGRNHQGERVMKAQEWLDMAKERCTKAAWKLNRLRADDEHVQEELFAATDQLHTAIEHCKDAAVRLGFKLNI